MTSALPRIALTMGDAAGIGPEVVARALCDASLRGCCRPIVFGNLKVLRRAAELVGGDLKFTPVADAAAAPLGAAEVAVCDTGDENVAEVPAGAVDPRAGLAAYDYLLAATRAALAGQVAAVVTAPLSKAALNAGGVPYPGHTEILADVCGSTAFAMMLYLPPAEGQCGKFGLGVAHVTLHTSLRSVPELLSLEGIQSKIELAARFMQRVGCAEPRVGVCALNPHAGEDGLFGDEERRIIQPAVANTNAHHIDAAGPFPADTLMLRATRGEFDAVVAMYHDQGHIALKLIGFDRAVNVTLGLPIVRTSPSHGTAFDIAWRGVASSAGMLEAVRLAAVLTRHPHRGTHEI